MYEDNGNGTAGKTSEGKTEDKMERLLEERLLGERLLEIAWGATDEDTKNRNARSLVRMAPTPHT